MVDVGFDLHALDLFEAHFELVEWLLSALAQRHSAFVRLMLGEELDGEMVAIEPGIDALDDVDGTIFEADQNHVADVH
jgi:hypothetical protein